MKRMRGLCLVLAVIVAVFCNGITAFADAAPELEERLTFDEYVEALTEVLEADAEISGTQIQSSSGTGGGNGGRAAITPETVELQTVVDSLNALSDSERDEFIDRFYKPETWDSKKETHGNGAPDGLTGRSSEPLRAGSTGEYWWYECWATDTRSILGIPIIVVRQDLGYYFYYNQRIDYVYKHDAYIQQNYSPMSQIVLEYKTTNFSDNNTRANGEHRFSYSVGPLQGLSAQVGNWYGSIWGGVNETHGWNWWQSP